MTEYKYTRGTSVLINGEIWKIVKIDYHDTHLSYKIMPADAINPDDENEEDSWEWQTELFITDHLLNDESDFLTTI